MKRIIPIVLILVIFGAGGFLFFKYSESLRGKFLTTITNQQEQSKSTEITTIKADAIKISEDNKELNYQTNLSYPEFSGIKNASAQQLINENVKNSAIKKADEFKSLAKENCDFSSLGADAPKWNCELDSGFNNYSYANGKILSVKMEYYQFTGGAHGMTEYVYLNYDLSTGKEINWKSVFKSNSDYMKVISDFAKTDLTNRIVNTKDSMSDEAWVLEGTKVSDDNYNTNVGFSENGLDVIFQQYQVAAYAAGPQESVVPYTTLKDVLDPNGLLGNLTK